MSEEAIVIWLHDKLEDAGHTVHREACGYVHGAGSGGCQQVRCDLYVMTSPDWYLHSRYPTIAIEVKPDGKGGNLSEGIRQCEGYMAAHSWHTFDKTTKDGKRNPAFRWYHNDDCLPRPSIALVACPGEDEAIESVRKGQLWWSRGVSFLRLRRNYPRLQFGCISQRMNTLVEAP